MSTLNYLYTINEFDDGKVTGEPYSCVWPRLYTSQLQAQAAVIKHVQENYLDGFELKPSDYDIALEKNAVGDICKVTMAFADWEGVIRIVRVEHETD